MGILSVFLPGESHGYRSLAGYSPWHHTELDTTEWLTLLLSFLISYDPLYLLFHLKFWFEPSPLFPLMNLANGLHILFIFSKNQLFVSLILYIVFFAPQWATVALSTFPGDPVAPAGTCGPVSYEVTVFSPVHIFPVHTGYCALQEWNFCFPQSCGIPVFKPCWSSKPNVLGAAPPDARAPSWRAWCGTWNSYRRTSVI